MSTAAAPPPRLHPNIAEVYRRRVAALAEALAADDAAEARELVRGLVDAVTLVPEAGSLRIEVRGELGAILRLAEGARNKKRPGGDAEALLVQMKMVAGAGNHRQLHSATSSLLTVAGAHNHLYRTQFEACLRR